MLHFDAGSTQKTKLTPRPALSGEAQLHAVAANMPTLTQNAPPSGAFIT